MTHRVLATMILTLIPLGGCSEDDGSSGGAMENRDVYVVQSAQVYTHMFRRFQAGDGVIAIAGNQEVMGGCDCTDTECTFVDCAFTTIVDGTSINVVLNGTVSWTIDHVTCDYDTQVDDPRGDSTVNTTCDVMLAMTSIDGTMTLTASGAIVLEKETCQDSEGTFDFTFDNIEFDPNDSCPQSGTLSLDLDVMTSCKEGDLSEQYVTMADGTHCLPLPD